VKLGSEPPYGSEKEESWEGTSGPKISEICVAEALKGSVTKQTDTAGARRKEYPSVLKKAGPQGDCSDQRRVDEEKKPGKQ